MGHSMTLYIQPVYNYDNNRIEYAEVLIRQYRGIQNVPDILRFITKNGIESRFDLEVLDETLRIIENNESITYPVSVNLCSRTVESPKIYKKIIGTIRKYNIKPNKIILEVNEETKFDSNNVIENLKKLKEFGVLLALDDFGTERTNMMSFVVNEFDIIKIDKSFISEDSWKIKKQVLDGVADICKRLGLDTIVEGVETKSQLDEIQRLGLNKVQGFFYKRPEPLVGYGKETEVK